MARFKCLFLRIVAFLEKHFKCNRETGDVDIPDSFMSCLQRHSATAPIVPPFSQCRLCSVPPRNVRSSSEIVETMSCFSRLKVKVDVVNIVKLQCSLPRSDLSVPGIYICSRMVRCALMALVMNSSRYPMGSLFSDCQGVALPQLVAVASNRSMWHAKAASLS